MDRRRSSSSVVVSLVGKEGLGGRGGTCHLVVVLRWWGGRGVWWRWGRTTGHGTGDGEGEDGEDGWELHFCCWWLWLDWFGVEVGFERLDDADAGDEKDIERWKCCLL